MMKVFSLTKYIFIASVLLLIPCETFAADEIIATTTASSTPSVACPITTSSTIDMDPNMGTYNVGDEMVIRVLATSIDCSVIQVEGRITYNPNAVEITNISREGSVVTSWEEPIIDKGIGEILFRGTFASSTTLEKGLLLTVHAIPRRVGETAIVFEEGVLLHPDDGSNVITGFTSGKYRIKAKDFTEPVSREPVFLDTASTGEVLGVTTESPAIIITSPTHSNQSAWYNATSGLFNFQFQGEVNQLRLGFDQKKDGRGSVLYAPIVSFKEITDLENGVWYLHALATVRSGARSESTYQIQVDNIPPEKFTMTEVNRSSASIPYITVTASATDTISGVDHYEFSVDGEKPVVWRNQNNDEYISPEIEPGEHDIIGYVVDKAGNSSSLKIHVQIDYLASPIIRLNDSSIKEGDVLSLSIESEPNATIDISISRNGDSPTVEHYVLNPSGKGTFDSALTLSPGEYSVFAVASDGLGGTSNKSEVLSVSVSTSVWGVISRHPFIPILALGLLTIMVLGMYVYRRINAIATEDLEEDEIVYKEDDMSMDQREDSNIYGAKVASGQIVLSPRPKHRGLGLPATRL